MEWILKKWAELDAQTLYAILALRSEIFVVEQNCVYQDLDGLDFSAMHLFAFAENDIIATARILPPEAGAAHIGRVCVDRKWRGTGTGKELMRRALKITRDQYPNTPVSIAAQHYLERFYSDLGFRTCSRPYLLDGIRHIDMIIP